MRYSKLTALIIANSFAYHCFGKNVSDSSMRFWAKVSGNSSAHFFNETPQPYKSENLFSGGYEISTGFNNSALSLSIGYRNHLFRFRQLNSVLDSSNGYGNFAQYNYIIESIPIRCQLNSNFRNYSVGFNFGLALNWGSFNKVVVTTLPSNEITFSPNKPRPRSQGINLSSGVSIEKHLNKKLTSGISMELFYDVTPTYVYENPSQMAGHRDYLNPFSYSRANFMGSLYFVCWFE